MTGAAVKQKLHDITEHADSKKLKAIYTLLENDSEEGDHAFTESDLKELDRRHENHISGKSKTYPQEEFMVAMRKYSTDGKNEMRNCTEA